MSGYDPDNVQEHLEYIRYFARDLLADGRLAGTQIGSVEQIRDKAIAALAALARAPVQGSLEAGASDGEAPSDRTKESQRGQP